MSKPKIFLAIPALTMAVLACNTLLPTPEPTATMVVITEPTSPVRQPDLPSTEAEVPRVPLEEAFAAYTTGAAIIVDVRAPSMYDISHIAGAINVPLGAIETDPTNLGLDKDQWIITYCT